MSWRSSTGAAVVSLLLLGACERPDPSLTTPATESDQVAASRSQAGIDAAQRANLSFGEVVPDGQVIEFLQRYDLKPTAIYMAAAGQFGIHRVRVTKASLGTVAEARRITARMMQRAEQSKKVRVARYLDQNSRESILADPEVTERSRSFLAALERQHHLQSSIYAEGAIVYGVEVLGEMQSIMSASRDPLVKEYQPAVERNGKVIVPQLRIPEGLKPSRDQDASVQGLSAAEIYDRLQQAAGRRN